MFNSTNLMANGRKYSKFFAQGKVCGRGISRNMLIFAPMVTKGRKAVISNWGRYPQTEAEVFTPSFVSETNSIVEAAPTLLPRGNGRSYGDAASHSHVISTLKLNRILAFDDQNGVITCQAGVLLADVLEFALPKGFFVPVTPGTKLVSIGGAIAADVHGKNHHVEGCFSRHIVSMKVLTESGNTVICSQTQEPDFFWKTVGGMGLTGIILECTFRLKPIQTSYMRVESLKARNLDEVMRFFAESQDWTYSVAWIDCLQKGKSLGRSLLMRGEHAKPEELSATQQRQPLKLVQNSTKTIPSFFPGWALNTLSVKLFNWLYYHKQARRIKKSIVDYDRYFYPLDGLLHWNRLYGKSGFTQYQFVIPEKQSREGLEAILNAIQKSGQGSFLAVLKLFGDADQRAPHVFPIRGYTLALDFKINDKLPDLLKELDRLVLQYEGRVYLAKDAFSRPELFDYFSPRSEGYFNSEQHQRLFE